MSRSILGLQELLETWLVDDDLPAETSNDTQASADPIVSDIADSLTELLGPRIGKAALSGLKAQRKYQRQFERRLNKHWQKPLELLDLCILVAREAGDDFNRQFSHKAKDSNDFRVPALVSLHARACRTASAVLTLLRSGYADDASALWRSLHEISVVSIFLSEHCQETARRYLLHDTIQRYGLALKLREHAAKLREEPIPQQDFDDLKAERDNLLQEFGKSFKEPYGWAALALRKKHPKIADIEAAVDLQHWRPYYQSASDNVHANVHGNYFSLGSSQLAHQVLLAGPSNMGLADPGQQTVISLCQVTSVLLTAKPYFDGIVIAKILGAWMDDTAKAFVQNQEELEQFASVDEDNVSQVPPVVARVGLTMQDRIRRLFTAHLKSSGL